MGTPTVNLTELTIVDVSTDMKLFAGSVYVQDNLLGQLYARTLVQYFAAEDLAEAEKISMQMALKFCPVDQGYAKHTPQVIEIPTEFILAVLAGKITKGIE